MMNEFNGLIQGIADKNNAVSQEKLDIYAAANNTFMSTEELTQSFINKVKNVPGQGVANVEPSFDTLNAEIAEVDMTVEDDEFPLDEKMTIGM